MGIGKSIRNKIHHNYKKMIKIYKNKYKSDRVRSIGISKPLTIVVGLVVLMFGVLLTIEMATVGSEVTKFKDDEDTQEEINRQLSEEIIKASALSYLQDTAPLLNFVKPEATVYISEVSNVAARLR